MPLTKKITISIDEEIIKSVDRLVTRKVFPNRSKAFQIAVEEEINKIDKNPLAVESAKLNKPKEQNSSEDGLWGFFNEWPDYY